MELFGQLDDKRTNKQTNKQTDGLTELFLKSLSRLKNKIVILVFILLSMWPPLNEYVKRIKILKCL